MDRYVGSPRDHGFVWSTHYVVTFGQDLSGWLGNFRVAKNCDKLQDHLHDASTGSFKGFFRFFMPQ